MKDNLLRALGVATLVAIFFLFNFHLSSCTGGGGGGSGDSTGPTFNPKRIVEPTILQPGSLILLECASKDCAVSANDPRYPKAVVVCTIPVTIPANTELKLRIIPKGDPENP